MRDTFVKTLVDLAKEDKNIELVTGDLGFGVLKPFWETVPDQFTNAGIAEQNMTTVAAGMALEGKIVFTYSIGNFPTLRCLEQIRNDCAYHNANVKVVCIGGGFVYGSLGMSHQRQRIWQFLGHCRMLLLWHLPIWLKQKNVRKHWQHVQEQRIFDLAEAEKKEFMIT